MLFFHPLLLQIFLLCFQYILFPWLICALFFFLQSLHHEMSLYIQQIKIDIEKGKLSDSISKLEKQINKEKKLIRRGRTKGLLKEHEVSHLFSFKCCHYFGIYLKQLCMSLAWD